MVAAAFGLLAFILLSPTGSLVHHPRHAALDTASLGIAPEVAKSMTPGPMAGLSPAPLD